MFTGIVEVVGVLSKLVKDAAAGSATMTITVPSESGLLKDCHLGDSIAVNGVCLTVTAFTDTTFTIGAAPETLRVTNLGELVESSRVNLERAVKADTRMGGHFVQGHVDTTAEILSVTPDGNALTFRFQPKDRECLKYIAHKGYVTIDGTSLTVTQVNDTEGWWEIMLIFYSQERVVLAQKTKGDTVNLEVDMMAKYAEKSLATIIGGEGGSILLLENIIRRIIAENQSAKH